MWWDKSPTQQYEALWVHKYGTEVVTSAQRSELFSPGGCKGYFPTRAFPSGQSSLFPITWNLKIHLSGWAFSGQMEAERLHRSQALAGVCCLAGALVSPAESELPAGEPYWTPDRALEQSTRRVLQDPGLPLLMKQSRQTDLVEGVRNHNKCLKLKGRWPPLAFYLFNCIFLC